MRIVRNYFWVFLIRRAIPAWFEKCEKTEVNNMFIFYEIFWFYCLAKRGSISFLGFITGIQRAFADISRCSQGPWGNYFWNYYFIILLFSRSITSLKVHEVIFSGIIILLSSRFFTFLKVYEVIATGVIISPFSKSMNNYYWLAKFQWV